MSIDKITVDLTNEPSATVEITIEHAHANKLILDTFTLEEDEITTLISQKADVSHTHDELHTHFNKSNLDTINQDLATTSTVNFTNLNVSGNVGIGNTAAAKLDVNGQAIFRSSLLVNNGTTNVAQFTYNGTDGLMYLKSGGNFTVRINSNGDSYFNGGNVGIGTGEPTNILSLGGNSARIFWMERNTTANTAGNSLTVQAGGATVGATDKVGGDLILKPGRSTGSAESGVQIQGCVAGSSGTGDNSFSTIIQVMGDKLGFHGVTPIIRAVLATGGGAVVDDVITALQNLGLVKQS